MASTLRRAPDHQFSTLLLNRPAPNMPPAIVDRNTVPANVIEISDDEDDFNHHRLDPVNPNLPAQIMPPHGTNSTLASTMNIRLKPDSSPITWRDNKRQKLDDGPEPSGSRSDYPRARLEFTNTDDGLAVAYPTFFDDTFVSNYGNVSPNSDPGTAERLFQETAATELKQPPYYFDAKLNIRMYCGSGHEQFPLPVDYDQSFQDACDIYDAFPWDEDEAVHKDPPITMVQQDCLARILDVFPAIQHKFVLDKIRSQHELIQFPDEEIEMHPDSAALIDEILEMDSYPKQVDSEEQPRDEFEDRLGKSIVWNRDHRQNPNYKKDATALLASHFDRVPTHFIHSTVNGKGNLFDAYLLIEGTESEYFQGTRPYNRSKRPRIQLEKKYQTLDPQRDPPYYCSLVVELQAAKQHSLRQKLESNQRQQIVDAEAANLEQHRVNGLLVQCKCCFDEEVPMNRTVVCTADEEHPFCYDCVKRLAENQIGMKRYQMQCMDESNCPHNLDNDGVGRAIPIKTFDRLQFNQQQAEIKAANIEGLEQCPNCDFQAICDPPEVLTIFSCQNPDCFKVTCRLCHEISHLPKTCEEVKKDRGLSVRHRIEEARTKAMIRTCPSCQSAIIKSDGCNKMRCTCGSIICYACKADLSKLRDGYEHFERGLATGKKCPLYDDKAVDRHVQETNAAEEKAIEEAKAEDHTIEESTLRIETGKGKAVDRRGQRNGTQGGPARGLNNLMDGAFDEEYLQNLQQNELFHQVVNDRGRRGARRNRWLAGFGARINPGPLPVIPGFAPPQGGVQPPVPNGPMPPNAQFPNQNKQDIFGNAFGAVGREHGYFTGVPAANYGYHEYLNQDQNQNHGYNYHAGFGGFGQAPQPMNPDVVDRDYMNTAQRIHEAREQLERRRRGLVERRNTVHNEVTLQTPNPEIFNVRNNHNTFAPQPVRLQNDGFDNGWQQHVQNYLDGGRPAPVADGNMANATQNDKGDRDGNIFEDFLRARQGYYGRQQANYVDPNQNQNQNQHLHQNMNGNRAPQAPQETQNHSQNRPSLFQNAATQNPGQRFDQTQPRPSIFGASSQTQNRNQDRTSQWIFGNTPAPPGTNAFGAPTQVNGGAPGPGRLPNRRQTMPLDSINNGNGNWTGFGDPNFRWQ